MKMMVILQFKTAEHFKFLTNFWAKNELETFKKWLQNNMYYKAYNSISNIKIVKKFNPDYIYIATEGPIGHAARKYCKNNNRHTN